LLSSGPPRAAEPASVRLPPPETTNGKPLMQALTLRHSSREFSPRKVPLAVLSNLHPWIAAGPKRRP
jgi:hypothetical protein